MSLSALDSVTDALEATKRFLIPFDRARWFRLAVIMLFVSGAGASFPNVPTGGFGDSTGPGTGPEDPGTAPGSAAGPITPDVTPELVVFLVGLILFVVALAVLWAVASAVMEFVFVESLSREHVRLRTYVKRNAWRGVHLFLFRAGVWLLTAGVVLVPLIVLGIALGGLGGLGGLSSVVVVGLVLLAIPLFLVAVVVAGTVVGFTNMFVVPVMLTEERGILSGWRRFVSTLRAEWKEFLVYLVVSLLLGFAVGVASGFLSLLVLVVVGIPFAVIGIPLVFVLGFNGLGAVVALVLGLMFVVVVFVVLLLVRVPFQTFLRYYALFVLGDTNPAFDVIPEARAAVRTDVGDEGVGGGDGREGTGPGDGPSPDDGPGGSGSPGEGGGADDGAGQTERDWTVERDDRS